MVLSPLRELASECIMSLLQHLPDLAWLLLAQVLACSTTIRSCQCARASMFCTAITMSHGAHGNGKGKQGLSTWCGGWDAESAGVVTASESDGDLDLSSATLASIAAMTDLALSATEPPCSRRASNMHLTAVSFAAVHSDRGPQDADHTCVAISGKPGLAWGQGQRTWLGRLCLGRAGTLGGGCQPGRGADWPRSSLLGSSLVLGSLPTGLHDPEVAPDGAAGAVAVARLQGLLLLRAGCRPAAGWFRCWAGRLRLACGSARGLRRLHSRLWLRLWLGCRLLL